MAIANIVVQSAKSKTIIFNILMAGVEVLHGSIQMTQALLSPEMFVYVSMGVGMIHAMGGVYLRSITTQALSEK